MRIGDKVKYRAKFLRSIGAYTGQLPFARGMVIGINSIEPRFKRLSNTVIVSVNWNNPDIPERVNLKNLEVYE